MNLGTKLLTSVEWCDKIGIEDGIILDPDGWDRTNFKYSFEQEKITREEFINRLAGSTVNFMKLKQLKIF
jgi:hypothetical protein